MGIAGKKCLAYKTFHEWFRITYFTFGLIFTNYVYCSIGNKFLVLLPKVFPNSSFQDKGGVVVIGDEDCKLKVVSDRPTKHKVKIEDDIKEEETTGERKSYQKIRVIVSSNVKLHLFVSLVLTD